MIKAARESFLPVDHSKFGVTAFATIAAVEDFNRVVSDRHVPQEEVEKMSSPGVEVVIQIKKGAYSNEPKRKRIGTI